MGYDERVQPDPEIERLEDDLRRSRFEPWDVEAFLAKRQRAKLEALEAPRSTPARAWQVFREITDPFAVFVGWVTLYVWFLLWMLDAL
jgi:hypothetical protein